jgi:lysophospholipase L1-like esterase
MKILFFGDSITDSSRERGSLESGRNQETYSIKPRAYGSGFVFLTATQLFYEKPNYYQILNRGASGDRLPQLYARIQLDVWNEKPDVLSILIGLNDVHTGTNPNYTDIERWGKIYRTMIRETQEKCPNTQIIICEPFALLETRETDEVLKYAAESKKIANEFGLPFVALQDKMDAVVKIYGVENCCYDGVHPHLVGSKVIADAWMDVFKKEVLKSIK